MFNGHRVLRITLLFTLIHFPLFKWKFLPEFLVKLLYVYYLRIILNTTYVYVFFVLNTFE